jgi:RHS repeat-associated protein
MIRNRISLAARHTLLFLGLSFAFVDVVRAQAPTPTPQESASDVEYLHADALGSIRVVTEMQGLVISRLDYLPFGEEVPVPSRTGLEGYEGLVLPAAPQRFTGKERDVETGLDYFGARYISPAAGRFASVDPKLTPGHPYDPQSWNKYAYARNSPERLVDPDGEDWADAVIGLMNGYGSTALGGKRIELSNSDYRAGQIVGDTMATIQGLAELAAGAAGAMSSTAGTLGSGGAAAGVFVPAAAASASLAAHGAVTVATGVGNLLKGPVQSLMGATSEGEGAVAGSDKGPRLVSNPKHHPNSASPEPGDVADLFKKSIVDSDGRRWAKGSDGTIHRFSAESNGEVHWNGSTAGTKPIRENDIPNEIRKALAK